jgi:hypothetical protein
VRGAVPKAHGAIRRSGRGEVAVGAQCQRVHGSRVSRELGGSFPRHVPELERLVLAAGKERSAVGGERQRQHLALVAVERRDLLPHVRVPQLDGLVETGGRQLGAVRAESDAVNVGVMALEHGLGLQGLAGVRFFRLIGFLRLIGQRGTARKDRNDTGNDQKVGSAHGSSHAMGLRPRAGPREACSGNLSGSSRAAFAGLYRPGELRDHRPPPGRARRNDSP